MTVRKYTDTAGLQLSTSKGTIELAKDTEFQLNGTRVVLGDVGLKIAAETATLIEAKSVELAKKQDPAGISKHKSSKHKMPKAPVRRSPQKNLAPKSHSSHQTHKSKMRPTSRNDLRALAVKGISKDMLDALHRKHGGNIDEEGGDTHDISVPHYGVKGMRKALKEHGAKVIGDWGYAHNDSHAESFYHKGERHRAPKAK